MTAKKVKIATQQDFEFLQRVMWNLEERLTNAEVLVEELNKRYKFVAFPWPDNRATLDRGENTNGR